MFLIKKLLGQSRALFITSTIIGGLSGVIAILLIRYINTVINGSQQNLVSLYGFGIFMLILFAGAISNFLSQRVMTFLGSTVTYHLSLMLVDRVLGTSLIKSEMVGKNRLYASLSQDIQSVSSAISILPPIIVNVTTIIVGSIYILFLSWKSVFILAALIVGLILFTIFTGKVLNFFMTNLRSKVDYSFHLTEGILEGMKELKINNQFRNFFISDKFSPAQDALRKVSNTIGIVFSAIYVLYDMLFFIAIGFCLFLGPSLFNISFSVAAEITFVLLFIRTPAQMVFHTVPEIERGNVAIKKIIEITESALTLDSDQPGSTGNELTKDRDWKKLELRNVHYKYPTQRYDFSGTEDDFLLGPVNMTIGRGEVVFIAGGNGAGKSTLAKIVTGLYRATSGDILVNEQIVDLNIESIGDYFSCVFSDFYLFAEMAEYYSKNNNNSVIEDLLMDFQLTEKIDLKNNFVPVRRLSAGQRRRLALVFAIASEKPIFVLDEWAADQDPNFREYFYKTILPKLKLMNKGVLVISHDDRYFDCADKLYQIDRGVFTEVIKPKVNTVVELSV